MKIPISENSETAGLVRRLVEIELAVEGVGRQVEALIDSYVLAQIVDDVSKLPRQKRVKRITTSWLQKNYRMGYARAARTMDELRAKGLIR